MKIYGETGMLGCALLKTYQDENYRTFIIAAASVGGVEFNTENNTFQYFQNVEIADDSLNNAKILADEWDTLIGVMSSCAYPATQQDGPLTEDQFFDGLPHHTNIGYGMAKRALAHGTMAIAEILKKRWFCPILTNLYGPHDRGFKDPARAHAIPAMIRKLDADAGGDGVLFGTGSELRQFTYVDDASRAIWGLPALGLASCLINVGDHTEYGMHEVAEMICDSLPNPAKPRWSGEHSGVFRKPIDTSKYGCMAGAVNFRPLAEGIAQTVAWYLENK